MDTAADHDICVTFYGDLLGKHAIWNI